MAAGAALAQPVAHSSAPAPQTLKKTMWGPQYLNGASIFPTYQDLGVGIYAIQARWNEIAPDAKPADPTDPADPAYQWPEYLNNAYADARAHGMEVAILIMGTPEWANGGKEWKWAPNDPRDFGDFATAISKKYSEVRHWMIWGEPNRRPNFAPFTPATKPTGKLNKAQQQAPRAYARILDAAYRALKTERPSNLVIGGDTFTASGRGDINTYQWARYMKLPGGERPRMVAAIPLRQPPRLLRLPAGP